MASQHQPVTNRGEAQWLCSLLQIAVMALNVLAIGLWQLPGLLCWGLFLAGALGVPVVGEALIAQARAEAPRWAGAVAVGVAFGLTAWVAALVAVHTAQSFGLIQLAQPLLTLY